MTEVMIGIDLGTTRLKVSAFARNGTLQHQLTKRHVDQSSGDLSWQDANDWWRDTVELISGVVSHLDNPEIAGLSVCGRGGAAVFADAKGNVLVHPWSDTRHRDELKALYEWRQGFDLSNYGAGLIAKYLWLRKHESRLASRISHGFFAKDWLLYRLTGEHVTDWTSGPDAAAWDPNIIQHHRLPGSLLPEPALPWTLAGSLLPEAALALGLAAGTPVAVGGHDGLCANIGVAAVRPGEMAVTIGTHAVVRMVMADTPAGAYRFYRMPPDGQIIGGNAVMGGRSADWFLDLLQTPEHNREAIFEMLDAYASKVPAGSRGVRFMPFLAGQVAPVARPGARAVFSGLSLDHGRHEMYRAVLEGASFAIRSIADQVQGWCGVPSVVRLTGSGARSELWANMLANVLGRPLEISDEAVEARGAVVCLAVALGQYTDLAGAASGLLQIQRTEVPDDEMSANYSKIFQHWQRINQLSRAFDAGRLT